MAHLIPFSNSFHYPPMEREDRPSGRIYHVPGVGEVPSVTTLLDRTKDKRALDEWAARVGEEVATRIKDESAHIGTVLHATIEAAIKGLPLSVGQNWLSIKGHSMAFDLMNKYLRFAEVIHGSEVALHYGSRYAGTTDMVAQYRGRLAILDFKQSLRPKKYQYITDYFHQLAAYALAHDETYGTNIDFAAVLIAVQTGETQEFTLTGREFEAFKLDWLQRLKRAEALEVPPAR